MITLAKRPKIIVLFALLWMGLIIAIQAYFIPRFETLTGQTLLDFSEFNSDTINLVVSAYGTEGIKLYGTIQILDFFVPLFLGLVLTILCLRLLFLITNRYYITGYFPLLITFFDFSENVIIFYILHQFPRKINANLCNSLLTISFIKNIIYVMSFISVFGLSLFWLVNKLKKPTANRVDRPAN